MHILRLTPYFYLAERALTWRELQYEPIGGMQVQITQVTDDIDRAGVRQTVVCPRRPGMRGEQSRGRNTVIRALRLPIAPFPTRTKGYIGLLVFWGLSVLVWSIGQRFRSRHRQYSAIHVHCSELPWTFLVAAAAAKVLARPLVLTVHCSALFTFHPETPLGRLLFRPAQLAERYAVRRADAVVVLTDRMRREYERSGLVRAERLHKISDGVLRSRFHVDDEVPEPAVRTVLYCGRFAPEKGWRDWVAAADLLVGRGYRDVRYVMCGDGNELPHCRRDVARRGLADFVTLRGHVDRDEVAQQMRETTVVVVPSIHEELGGTVLEAMMARRAVVTTDVGGLSEVVSDGETGLLVPARAPERLADAIAKLLDDPQLRRRMAEQGQREVLAYDSEALAHVMTDLYRSVADRTGAEARRPGPPEGTAEGRRRGEESGARMD